jgi:hypothetical protein
MKVREVVRSEVLYGHFAEAMEICHEFGAQAQAKNLPPTTYFFPVAGRGNVIVMHTDYESLAAYETACEVYASDPELMKNQRRLGSICAQGSTETELLGELPEHIA